MHPHAVPVTLIVYTQHKLYVPVAQANSFVLHTSLGQPLMSRYGAVAPGLSWQQLQDPFHAVIQTRVSASLCCI